MLNVSEKIEPLGNGIKIIVSDTHHFSTDTILLADFAAVKKNDKTADLGTGCGTIPLLWARHQPQLFVSAIDIQKNAIDMLKRSIDINSKNGIKAVNNIHPIVADINNLNGICEFGSYNLVVCNPPYKLSGSGIKNPDAAKKIARHEEYCTINDICKTASKLLQFSGRFCICQRPERLTDVLLSLRANSLEPKRLRFVQQRKNKEPKLFLLEARRGGKPGFMQVLPTLFIEDDNGGFSDEMKKIYGCYKEGYINE